MKELNVLIWLVKERQTGELYHLEGKSRQISETYEIGEIDEKRI
jgi:hypothetical protein